MRSTFYQARYVNWPPVSIFAYGNPNSPYWQEQAEAAVAEFDRKAASLLTPQEWDDFNEYFLGHYGEGVTWKQAYECYHAAAEALAPGVTVEAVACAAGILPEPAELESGSRKRHPNCLEAS
jgi:hypothetical protein